MGLVTRTRSAEETRALGERLGRLLGAGDVVALVGDLGAGKTTLAQGIARGLGVRTQVGSPTFTFVREHRGRVALRHVDLYRVERPADLDDLALEEAIGGAGVAIVEWADRADGYLPPEYLRVTIRVTGDDERELILEPVGERCAAIAARVAGGAA